MDTIGGGAGSKAAQSRGEDQKLGGRMHSGPQQGPAADSEARSVGFKKHETFLSHPR